MGVDDFGVEPEVVLGAALLCPCDMLGDGPPRLCPVDTADTDNARMATTPV
jgi:hypothetical protein